MIGFGFFLIFFIDFLYMRRPHLHNNGIECVRAGVSASREKRINWIYWTECKKKTRKIPAAAKVLYRASILPVHSTFCANIREIVKCSPNTFRFASIVFRITSNWHCLSLKKFSSAKCWPLFISLVCFFLTDLRAASIRRVMAFLLFTLYLLDYLVRRLSSFAYDHLSKGKWMKLLVTTVKNKTKVPEQAYMHLSFIFGWFFFLNKKKDNNKRKSTEKHQMGR